MRQPSSPNSPILVSTPATRTGPPRSLSFLHVQSLSSTPSHLNDLYESDSNAKAGVLTIEGSELFAPFEGMSKNFKLERALEARDQDSPVGTRSPIFHDSPNQASPLLGFISSHPTRNQADSTRELQGENDTNSQRSNGHTSVQILPKRTVTYHTGVPPNGPKKPPFRQSVSLPHHIYDHKNSENKVEGTNVGHTKWAKLRSLMPQIISRKGSIVPGPSDSTSNAINIVDELITGGLSTLMLKLWFERDEKGQRRIPIFLHRLRIRVSDSLHPMHGHKSVFRIECDYANGVAKWVVYRQLWDFSLLHTHYALSNVYGRKVENLPNFPKSIARLHSFKFLKKERGDKISKADFARLQRKSLETYFIELIRAVMFHPSANRLCTFLEMSSVFISLAYSRGAQFKAGFLRIEPSGSGSPHFGRKSAGWYERREKRWTVVSDGYLVAVEEPGELDVWDVFLLDSDFRIERPKRYYRQGFDLLFPYDQHKGQTSPEAVLSTSGDEPLTRFSVPSIASWISNSFRTPFNSQGRDLKTEKTDTIRNEDSDFSPSSSAANLRAPTPLLDPSTNTNPLQAEDIQISTQQAFRDGPMDETRQAQDEQRGGITSKEVSQHTFYVVNSQMRLKLVAKNNRQMLQFITALEKAAAASPYTGANRFGSFAPVRLNVSAQWLVDGRDYFWNLSRAVYLAKECIYIHDWWLSPEVLLRRPGKDKYRLDRLLQRKAREGVKIYIILYQEVSNRTTPTDSNYAKQRLISLHENIMVQRSPSHFQTGTFYWAHHEKLCVIDKTIAFMGGFDLCFGRWDTPQHVVMDDVAGTDRLEIWPGKDYSNPRMLDFYDLDKPQEDMYDRMKIPRMPWHDVGMQVIGQPACDLARHFVERWNYLLRIKNHSKKIPFLLPPPEFRLGDLDKLCLTGTCELQICRSAGPWSLGTPARVEHSIQTAYLRAIQQSEHFIYIENQFFITSTTINDVKIENQIADAIVRRIFRAHEDGTPWKCCVVIPLLPGFTYPVDHSDASAVRIILECQNKTICRGPNSIFARLRKQGINADDYICFFSLRNWGKLRGDVLTTEQVYIHSKICIVDDRLAIIGSANINERSQRGDRDSELAAVIRDTEMIESSMAGQPFKVGRFAHTLRVRLMREHLGIDVDSLNEDTLTTRVPVEQYYEQEPWDPDNEQTYGQKSGITHVSDSRQKMALGNFVAEGMGNVDQVIRAEGETTFSDIAKHADQAWLLYENSSPIKGDQISSVGRIRDGKRPETEGVDAGLGSTSSEKHGQFGTLDGTEQQFVKNFDRESVIEEPAQSQLGVRNPWILPTQMPKIDADDFDDPISDRFWNEVWNASAVHNTEVFRKVFHAIPDDRVTTWKQYKEYVAHHERLNKPWDETGMPIGRVPSETGDESALPGPKLYDVDDASGGSKDRGDCVNEKTSAQNERPQPSRNGKQPFEPWEREEMEKLLREVNGHLVLYPTKFLEAEHDADNFLFNADRLLPLPLYI